MDRGRRSHDFKYNQDRQQDYGRQRFGPPAPRQSGGSYNNGDPGRNSGSSSYTRDSYGRGRGSSYGAANGGNGGRVKRDYRSMDSLPPPPPSFGPPMPAPSREAELGSAARPGITQNVVSSSGSEELLQQEYFNLPDSAKAIGLERIMRRPDFGTQGRPVKLKANHFRVTCSLKEVYHYNVDIVPIRRRKTDPDQGEPERSPSVAARKMTPDINRAAMSQLAIDQGWPPSTWVFDGRKNLYTTSPIIGHDEMLQAMVKTAEPGMPKQHSYEINMTAPTAVNISALMDFLNGHGTAVPQDALQVLDVALRHTISGNVDVQATARAIFWRDTRVARPLGSGAEVWLGYSQTLRATLSGLTVNIDMAATGFLEEQPVINFLLSRLRMRDVRQLGNLSLQQHRDAAKAIKNIKVEYRLLGEVKRRSKAKGLTEQGADISMFKPDSAAEDISVERYYSQKYRMPNGAGFRLEHPELPCIEVGIKERKPVWLPMELCWILKGQRVGKLDEQQTAQMIKAAAMKPADRMRHIDHSLAFAGLADDPCLEAFKMRIDNRMIEVDGRQLPAPHLQYKDSQPLQPQQGAWNMQNKRLYVPGQIQSFAVVSFLARNRAGGPPQDPKSLQAFMLEVLGACSNCGMSIPLGPHHQNIPDDIILWHDARSAYPGETMQAAHRAAAQYWRIPPDIIFVILPDRGGTEVYRAVKQASDSHLGVPSQCFNPKKGSIGEPPRRPRAQYCGSVALKVNAKVRGLNAVVAKQHNSPVPPGHPFWMKDPYMVLGADVTHPTGCNTASPSVAAVVGSYDQFVSKYASQIWTLGHRVETMTGLKKVVEKLLRHFVHRNGGQEKNILPKRMLYYRDGVSESQFQKVKEMELSQIAAACCAVAGRDPSGIKITYIMINKRHHTRLFPANPRSMDADRNGNVLPGTVVDRSIVAPHLYDFYLNAHASIQGTSRPAHYTVLYDQNQFSADQLQRFTFDLTHLQCRCTRSVSVVAPAYYAHLAAFRGRLMLGGAASDAESSHSGQTINMIEFAHISEALLGRLFYV